MRFGGAATNSGLESLGPTVGPDGHEACPWCGAGFDEITHIQAAGQVSINGDHECDRCGAVWSPPVPPVLGWIMVGGFGLLGFGSITFGILAGVIGHVNPSGVLTGGLVLGWAWSSVVGARRLARGDFSKLKMRREGMPELRIGSPLLAELPPAKPLSLWTKVGMAVLAFLLFFGFKLLSGVVGPAIGRSVVASDPGDGTLNSGLPALPDLDLREVAGDPPGQMASLRLGMSKQDVIKIMGKPSFRQDESNESVFTWSPGVQAKGSIFVTFTKAKLDGVEYLDDSGSYHLAKQGWLKTPKF